jgi:putative hydrolase of the HAD superfamily
MTIPIRNVFFDVGNTLLFPNRDIILAPLRKRNADAPLELWHEIERGTKKKFDAGMHDGKPDLGFWNLFHTSLLERLGIDDVGVRDQLVAAMRTSSNWTDIRPDTCQRLQAIGEKFRIGVISNADGKIHEVLGRCGIAGCFRSITDSGIVGYEKPHRAIFEAALQDMNARPEESLYVGDVRSVDYDGATGVGMQAMLFDVSGAYRDSGLPRVVSLEELQERLAT